MAPKAAKKGSAKKPNTAGDSAGGKREAYLIKAPFEEVQYVVSLTTFFWV